jgi:hypothetical protein
MNAYEKSVALELTGTDAEQVAILQTLTAGPIPVGNVLQWFDEQNLGELDPIENRWVGSLVDLVRNLQTPLPVSGGLRKLFAHLAKRTSQIIDTTDLSYSVDLFALLGALIEMGVMTVEQRDSFYALDGGRPYKDLTAEQFAAQRTAAAEATQLADDIDALNSDWTAILNEGGINVALAAGDRDGLKTALAAAIEVL